MKPKCIVYLECYNGHKWQTEINSYCSDIQIKDYFLDNVFNAPTEKERSICIKCKIVRK